MNGINKDIREKRKTKDNSFAKNAPLKPASLRRISIEPEAVHVLSRQKRQQCSSFNEILKRERGGSTYVPSTSRPKSTSTCFLLFPFPYEEHQWQKQGQIPKNNNKGQQFGNKRRTSETSVVEKNINETERCPRFLHNGVIHTCLGTCIEFNQSQLSEAL
jgi:hypothetical protein